MSDEPAEPASGLEESRRFYADVVAPALRRRWGALTHSAARLGPGSEALGLDDAISRDHDWGPQLTLLVRADRVRAVTAHLDDVLPATYLGLPVRFPTTHDGVVRHRVGVCDADRFVPDRLGSPLPLDVVGWLALTGQAALELLAGEVFHDDGVLGRIRATLAWYPDDLWRYVLAAGWARLAEELPLHGRAGARGDDTGSRVIAGRLAGTAMHLAFLLERRWPPYPKWRGTAFATLPAAATTAVPLARATSAATWQEREAALREVLAVLRTLQSGLGLPTAATAVEPFFDRPFLGVPQAAADVLLGSITDPAVAALPGGVGSIEQWVDNVAVLTDPGRRLAAVAAVVHP